MSIRDELRSEFLGTKVEFKKEIVKVGKKEVEVRQPTNKARGELFKKATSDDGKIDSLEFMIWGIIYNTFVPGTNELVFEETDYDVLVNRPAGGVTDELRDKVMELLNVGEDVEKK